ncbi:hypothetical protein EVJ58_g6237 [Rhodofomes roseus]|uniref:RRM domain-containing protein n=1 Tax=Rhodofomes roseus TaxID=34475 RepID=A0A4Y9YA02_9APHY|nr:hypothetical protein EVJ58_g6237 [Rhodofomes roseus]
MPAALEDDIYDDLYGDSADVKDPAPQVPSPTEYAPRETQRSHSPEDTKPPAGVGSLPAKPSQSSELSYSAQIAQQFSTYKQTPAQERQSRSTTSHSAGGNDSSSASLQDASEGLRKYFSEFGEVEDCTILRDQEGRSRGFAFLTFKEPSSVNAVMVREHVLDGKAIDPKRAIPREEHLRNTRYFVGGLSHTTTSDTMRVFFSTFGKVVDCTVMVDRETGRSKGFGFVTFEDASNTDQLVGRGDLILDEKAIEVKVAQPRNQRDQSRMGRTTRESTYEAGANSMGFQAAQRPAVNPQQMSMLMMGQLPMMSGNMPMGMNPMGVGMNMGMGMNNASAGAGAGGGMGMMPMSPQMNNFGGMSGGGMGSPMGAGMGGGMNAGRGMGMGNMGGGMGGNMRMGMGPMGMNTQNMGMMRSFINNAGPMMRQGMGMMGGMGGGMSPMARGRGSPMMNAGVGPQRNAVRGQHGYHPYAR